SVPIREKIDVLQPAGYLLRHLAIVQARGQNEYIFQRQLRRTVERISQLALETATFDSRPSREARDKKVRDLDSALDGARPVLPRQQFLLIQPCLQPGSLKRSIEPSRVQHVFLDVCNEHARAPARYELECPIAAWTENAKPVNVDLVPL